MITAHKRGIEQLKLNLVPRGLVMISALNKYPDPAATGNYRTKLQSIMRQMVA
ncbi:hypothetical protein LG200_03645 [Methylobacillus caricis]|uniref:hypothetical protein n=1 Tax=Methylobacillus caricis TaxID=1971611 RepID=UPI001CFF9891|nr:hypothetical protein [Methylobacillus caricis]MCB5187100.1 hypothetical protein [Methylobacillus caricis]